MNNMQIFKTVLAKHYAELFKTADYAMAAKRYTPESMADKMAEGLAQGSASKDGDGIKRTCKELGVKHTYAAITAYVSA